jgi:hypothetical protein
VPERPVEVDAVVLDEPVVVPGLTVPDYPLAPPDIDGEADGHARRSHRLLVAGREVGLGQVTCAQRNTGYYKRTGGDGG